MNIIPLGTFILSLILRTTEDRRCSALYWRHNPHQPLQGQRSAFVEFHPAAPQGGTGGDRKFRNQSATRDSLLGRQQPGICLVVPSSGINGGSSSD